jgi:hypothetical protein
MIRLNYKANLKFLWWEELMLILFYLNIFISSIKWYFMVIKYLHKINVTLWDNTLFENRLQMSNNATNINHINTKALSSRFIFCNRQHGFRVQKIFHLKLCNTYLGSRNYHAKYKWWSKLNDITVIFALS